MAPVFARLRLVCALTLAAAGAARAAPPADARPQVAVMAFTASGAPGSLAAAATGAVAAELDRLGAFKVLAEDDVMKLLSLEHRQQMLGCVRGNCATESAGAAGAAGAEYMVTGQVSKVGADEAATYGIDLALTSTRTRERISSITDVAPSEAALVRAVPRLVARLTERVLGAHTGRLVVQTNEAGAVVKIDEKVRGTTPVPRPLDVPAGPRSLVVEKEGFVAWQSDLTIQPGRSRLESVTLVPSPDYIQAYETRARRIRAGAWAATALAVAGATTAVVFQMRASSAYGDTATPGTFAYYKQKVLDQASAPQGVDYRALMDRRKNDVTFDQNVSYVGMSLGAIGAGLATGLWLMGDDPARYASYRAVAAVLPGGASITVARAF
jgi:hypothetical protein